MEDMERTVISRIATEAITPAIRKECRPRPQRLRHRADQIDLIISYEGEHRARPKNEHERDDRSSDHNGASDVARRCVSFTGQNAHIFKSGESANCQFAEDVEAIKERHRGRCDLKRPICVEISASETDEW